MATKGTKWFLRRSIDLIPYMLFMAAREALIPPQEWPVTTAARPVPVTGEASVPGASADVGEAPVSREVPAAEPVAE